MLGWVPLVYFPAWILNYVKFLNSWMWHLWENRRRLLSLLECMAEVVFWIAELYILHEYGVWPRHDLTCLSVGMVLIFVVQMLCPISPFRKVQATNWKIHLFYVSIFTVCFPFSLFTLTFQNVWGFTMPFQSQYASFFTFTFQNVWGGGGREAIWEKRGGGGPEIQHTFQSTGAWGQVEYNGLWIGRIYFWRQVEYNCEDR